MSASLRRRAHDALQVGHNGPTVLVVLGFRRGVAGAGIGEPLPSDHAGPQPRFLSSPTRVPFSALAK